MSRVRLSWIVAAGTLSVLLCSACGSVGNTAGSPSSKPGVAQIGQTQVKAVGADLEGVDWEKDEDFGEPSTDGSYQNPRLYRFSVGIRF